MTRIVDNFCSSTWSDYKLLNGVQLCERVSPNFVLVTIEMTIHLCKFSYLNKVEVKSWGKFNLHLLSSVVIH
jgi:hypothetical protein